jgi:WD40 repeat protein
LAINPNGQLLYVPTGEEGSANYINVVDANTGDIVRRVYFSNRSHVNYPDACIIPVGDVKLASYGTDGYASNVAHVWNCMNSFNEAMPCINVVDRDRSSIFGGLIDRI